MDLIFEEATEQDIPDLTRVMTLAFDDDARKHLGQEKGGPPGYDNGESAEGRAYLYLGFSSGLSPTAAWTAEGNQAAATFGVSVGTGLVAFRRPGRSCGKS